MDSTRVSEALNPGSIPGEATPFSYHPMQKHILFCLLFVLAYNSAHSQTAVPDSAPSTTLTPTKPAEYYIDQGVKYFRTMQSDVPIHVKPNYSDLVVRWEWHPWLLLTGYKRGNMITSDIFLKLYPTAYNLINCKYFAVQPFCRCHVVFNYSGKLIPIYEEFTFNNAGEITFIEAWSDYPSLLPMAKNDYWAEGDSVNRLSTRVPGLGNATGRINPKAQWMKNAAVNDTVLADLLNRIKHPISTYMRELKMQRKEMEEADKPPAGDVYPYREN